MSWAFVGVGRGYERKKEKKKKKKKEISELSPGYFVNRRDVTMPGDTKNRTDREATTVENSRALDAHLIWISLPCDTCNSTGEPSAIGDFSARSSDAA